MITEMPLWMRIYAVTALLLLCVGAWMTRETFADFIHPLAWAGVLSTIMCGWRGRVHGNGN